MTKPISNEDLKERLVALTRDLILIPSIPSKPEERRRCYEFIKNHLESLEHIEIREFEQNGIPSLWAGPPGIEKPQILLCGHLDVIMHPDVASYRSRIQDGRIYGPGAGDMKGALAILLEVFRYVHTKKPKASLAIAVTADEETGGRCGVGYLFDKEGLRCAKAMIPDGGSLNEITVEEKGVLHLRLSCGGHSAHAARPWLARNPIEELMARLTDLKTYFATLKTPEGHWYPTCAVTIFTTDNQTTNRVPSEASAVLDIRFPPPFTLKGLTAKIQEILGAEVKSEVILMAEPTHLAPDALYQKITEDVTGRKAVLIRDDGGSDARYMAPYGIPVMMSRPLVGNLHAEDEWIEIDSMVALYRIYERYLMEVL